MKDNQMKKYLVWVLIATLVIAVGCGKKTPETLQVEESGVFVIKEKMFIAQCNDIYLNPKDYMDQTIQVEGMFGLFPNEEKGTTYHCVYRNGPGCCGNDGVAGFEMEYEGKYPKENDWIQVSGKIKLVKDGEREYVVLKVTELKVLDVRGAEFVAN